MELPFVLHDKITDFLLSIPDIQNSTSQQALIYRAGLDLQLQNQILFGKSSIQFVSLLIQTLLNYGRLSDGRYGLEAILESAKNYVGQDKRAYCKTLLEELATITEKQSPRSSESPKKFYTLHTKQANALHSPNEFQQEYELLSEKIHGLRMAYIIESDAGTRFKLKKQIEEEEYNLKKLKPLFST